MGEDRDQGSGISVQTGVELIAVERRRQVDEEGHTSERDDLHMEGELAMAGAFYAAPRPIRTVEICQPWDPDKWPVNFPNMKKHTRLEQLAIAGALIAAEIDRLLRAEAVAKEFPDDEPNRPGLGWEPDGGHHGRR